MHNKNVDPYAIFALICSDLVCIRAMAKGMKRRCQRRRLDGKKHSMQKNGRENETKTGVPAMEIG